MQCLAIKYGGSIKRLSVVKHGQTSRLTHCADDVFEGIQQGCEVVRYHSLYVDVRQAAELVELASADDGDENGIVPMAIKHRTKPFWAVQYHPESVCTDGSGLRLAQNFWRCAVRWRSKHGIVAEWWNGCAETHFSAKRWPVINAHIPRQGSTRRQKVSYITVSCASIDIPSLCEMLGASQRGSDFVLLDSAAHPGRYSIIGCLNTTSLKIQYFVGSSALSLIQGTRCTTVDLEGRDIWSWIADFMSMRMAADGAESVPFWGGLIGYLSYDVGVDTLRSKHHFKVRDFETLPDVNLVMVERSIVVDSHAGILTIQSILPNDDDWLSSIASRVERRDVTVVLKEKSPASKANPQLVIPDKALYISDIKKAQSFLFAGESYELCLTAQTQLLFPRAEDPTTFSWDLYKRVRTANPAPFASYLRLHPATLVSSSPERFLSYSRPPSQRFQLRPIKGTVKKETCPTRRDAEELLSCAKEVGENLMIVDLIRHDLHGAVGQQVEVHQFCKVEEYETVWQLVSVIEGRAPGADQLYDPQLGWEVLRHSLPPGSMTGAPKKRSVELLDTLESSNRGIYSGVVGYWCVGGGGDWSVVIRSCFKVDAESDSHCRKPDEGPYERWHLGAGGAITALSDPEAEWEEMLTKLRSVTRAFSSTSEG